MGVNFVQISSVVRMKNLPPKWRKYIFLGVWLLSTAGLGWQVWDGQHSFNSQATLPALLALLVCTIALLWWFASSAPAMPPDPSQSRRGVFILLVVLAIGILFPLRDLVGPPLLFALPIFALFVLVVLRPQLSRQQVGYALLLALIAGIAGLGARWVTFSPAGWAGLQIALVLPGLLAGWSLLHRTGLLPAGIGQSLYLTEGLAAATRGFAGGILLSIPWALGLVVLGATEGETWVEHWWQPLVAIQPGIAEEAWGRVLLVPALYVILRRAAQGRVALIGAVVIMAYWFAYLHTAGGIGAAFSVAMIGTLFTLPISFIWLQKGLETAIGFHFWLDFVKFVTAYLINQSF
jgi:hypothetical protein